jgi:uncharacterized glyoxalase superfamily protein PhnB
MADEFGLLPTGFRVKTDDDIASSLISRMRPKWGASFDFTEGSPDGQLLRVFAAELGEAWRAGQALYGQLSRDTATGVGLDAVLLRTGTLRADAEPSSVTLLLIGTDGTDVASGSRVLSASTDTAWRTIADATIVTVDALDLDHVIYADGEIVTDAGNVYRYLNTGGNGPGSGPNDDPENVTDAGVASLTANWELLGEGDGAVSVAAVSIDTGAVVGVAYDLAVIETPIGGWSAVYNLLDADLGRDEATDAEARIAGEEDLARPAATTKDAIRQTLLRIADVTAVRVFQNLTDATDADGVPPHAIECLVAGGDDQTILDTLFTECVAAGIATYGNTSGTVTDSEGVDWTIYFSRAELVDIRVKVTLVKVAHDDADPTSYPTDGDDQVALAIVTAGDARAAGYNAVASKIAAIANGITGVLDVTEVLISGAVHPAVPLNPPVASTTIAISTRQQASWDTTRIVLVTSNGVP